MTIDWAHFAPLSALAGGALIGLAAALLILGLGRILGAAGIVGGALESHGAEAPWRAPSPGVDSTMALPPRRPAAVPGGDRSLLPVSTGRRRRPGR